MKTLVAFIDPVKTMLEKSFDYDGIIRACQGAMNDPNNVKVVEGKTVRGAVKGGQSYNTAGTLKVANLTWSERLNLDYETKYTAPIEAVKWNDSIALHFKRSGNPSGELHLGIVPRHVMDWFTKFPLASDADKKAKADAKAKEKADAKAALEETRKQVADKSNGKRETTPASA